jgi:hypothetical protein
MEDGRAMVMKWNKTNKGPTQSVVERGCSVVISRSSEGLMCWASSVKENYCFADDPSFIDLRLLEKPPLELRSMHPRGYAEDVIVVRRGLG